MEGDWEYMPILHTPLCLTSEVALCTGSLWWTRRHLSNQHLISQRHRDSGTILLICPFHHDAALGYLFWWTLTSSHCLVYILNVFLTLKRVLDARKCREQTNLSLIFILSKLFGKPGIPSKNVTFSSKTMYGQPKLWLIMRKTSGFWIAYHRPIVDSFSDSVSGYIISFFLMLWCIKSSINRSK